MAPFPKPVFVVVPGASQSPSHYSYLLHLLQLAGYPTHAAVLPSVGTGDQITAQDDSDYIRTHMLLPVLDTEEHDVIMVMHSYSGMPGSAAAQGLGKAERAAAGKKSAILGQIFLASILPLGGDGKDVVATFGGQLPPHLRPDEPANLLRCDDPRPVLYNDVPSALADVAVAAAMCQGMTSFKSPCPRATWDQADFKGRCAYIRTLNDRALPYEVQKVMLDGTGQEWIVKDIDTGHSPQLSQPEKLCDMLVELAKQFEAL